MGARCGGDGARRPEPRPNAVSDRSKGAAEIADILQKLQQRLDYAIAGRVRSLSGEYQMLRGARSREPVPTARNLTRFTERGARKKQEEEVKKQAQADVKAGAGR